MKLADELTLKYECYRRNGNAVFAVTLSTFVKSESFARRHMPSYWREHFIDRILKELPYKAKRKVDHDCVVECSPDGYYHFHGFFALPAAYSRRIWAEGSLCKSLRCALESFRSRGRSRMFQVNKFLIEPVRNVAAWAMYCTKTLDCRQRE
jgi:hypothetical protein